MRLKSAVLLVGVCLLLLGCAQQSAAATSGPQAGMRMQVTRTYQLLTCPQCTALSMTVRDSTEVRQLYAAALALPAVPPGHLLECPNDLGIVYRLTFFKGAASVAKMDLSATGCRLLVIQNHGRFTNEAFITLFEQVTRLPSLVPPPVN